MLKILAFEKRMTDTLEGLEIYSSTKTSIEYNELYLSNLFEGYYEEQFSVEITSSDPSLLCLLGKAEEEEGNLYFGFWMTETNEIFQVQMIHEGSLSAQSRSGSFLKCQFFINGLPEILPIEIKMTP